MIQGTVASYYDRTVAQYRGYAGRSLGLHFGYYDEQARTHAASLFRMNAILAEAAGVRDGASILDAGCGVGGSAIWLARRFPAAHVVGLTLSTAQVLEGQKHVARANLPNAPAIIAGDYNHTGFASGSADVWWQLESLCHSPDKAATMREAYRVLRPGGTIAIADAFLRVDALTNEQNALYEAWRTCWAVPALTTRDTLTKIMREAGFEEPQGKNVSAHVLPSARRIHRASQLMFPVARAMRTVGIANREQVENLRGGVLQLRVAMEIAEYSIVVARKPSQAPSAT